MKLKGGGGGAWAAAMQLLNSYSEFQINNQKSESNDLDFLILSKGSKKHQVGMLQQEA